MASSTTADPSALSVAPGAECHESRCAPIMTTSSFSAGSVPGQFRQHVVAVAIVVEIPGLDVDAELDGNPGLQHPDDHVVVLAGDDD